MKNVLLTGFVMLGVGIAVGWAIKPAPPAVLPRVAAEISTSKALAAAEVTSPNVLPGPAKRPQRMPAVKEPTKPELDQATKIQEDMLKTMVERHRTKLEQRMVSLSEKLDLTTAQKSGINAWLEQKMKEMESLDLFEPVSVIKSTELISSLTNEVLEAHLATSLTADQQAALADFKDNDQHLKIDALALKSLSKLQGMIEFEEGQRDEVYKILTKNAEASLLADTKNPGSSKLFMEGMGIDMDPYDLGLQQMMMDMAKPKGTGDDQTPVTQTMRERFNKRVGEKINQLRSVLNDKQLNQYEKELQSKGMGVYGPIITGVIPIPSP